MADNTTELEVLDEIVDVLGGTSGQYETVVPVLQQIKELLAAGITDPEAIAEAVAAWLDEHPEATTTVRDGSITVMKLAEDVIELLDNKADIDGYYSQLTAGLAENLIGRGDAVPAEYLYRTAGGTADIEDGIATIDCIKGNTLVWNQMVNPSMIMYVNSAYATKEMVGDVIKATSTVASAPAASFYIPEMVYPKINNHTLLCVADVKVTSSASSTTFRFGYASQGTAYNKEITSGSWKRFVSTLEVNMQSGASNNAFVYYDTNANLSVGDTVEIKNIQLFDLTLMFGSGNEPATVEEFEAMFPLPYYPYSAPKLLPVDIRGIETVGFNAYNPSTGEAELLGGHQYQISGTYTSLSYSTGESIAFDSDGIFTPSDNGTLTVTGGNATDTCVHLVWSGYRNGEYEEYWSAERPIDTSRFFPTGLKKVGDKADALYADHYDTVIASYTFTGSETLQINDWQPTEDTFAIGFPLALLNAQWPVTTGVISDVRMAELETIPYGDSYFGTKTGICLAPKPQADAYSIFVRVPKTLADNKNTLMTWLAGKTVYYVLATPTSTPIDPPLNLSYKVSDFGTERIMVDETADAPQTAPVPMEVEYGINAIDTIRRLPKEYQSHKSMGQFTAALESSLGVDITETWDETEQRYEYEVSDFELADEAFACIATPDGPTATANHAVNTYLTMGGKLYKVTSAIAVGETITAGTNVTQTTVMAELIALTA